MRGIAKKSIVKLKWSSQNFSMPKEGTEQNTATATKEKQSK